MSHLEYMTGKCCLHRAVGWQRPYEWPIFAGHFRQKSTVFSCLFAGKDLKAKPSDASSPCCTFESKIGPYVSANSQSGIISGIIRPKDNTLVLFLSHSHTCKHVRAHFFNLSVHSYSHDACSWVLAPFAHTHKRTLTQTHTQTCTPQELKWKGA